MAFFIYLLPVLIVVAAMVSVESYQTMLNASQRRRKRLEWAAARVESIRILKADKQ